MPQDARFPLPLVKRAFDHRETRQAWRRARMRVVAGLAVFVVLTVAVLLLVGEYATQLELSDTDVVPAVYFGIFFPAALYSYISSMRRLGRMRRVLQSYAWDHGEGARKHPGATESQGVAVQLRQGSDGWSRPMVARNPLRWYRWDKRMENGMWIAGDPRSGAVMALPGGRGLMTLHRRER